MVKQKCAFTIKEGGTVSPTIGEGESLIKALVDKRKSMWQRGESLSTDRRICKENADTILDTPLLRDAVIRKPYLLIECCFSLVNKKKRDAPFFLNRVQRDFIERLETEGPSRPFFILKGRQQGFTTLITAIQLSFAIVRRNFSGFTVADRDDNVKTIFLDKAKVIYSRLPKRLKPSEKFNSASELFFHRLNSSWRVACASENVGRSRTLSFIHYSEASFFKCSLSSLQRSIQESLVSDAICIYETTARGYGDAKELWDSGSCINLFYGWWMTDEYEADSAPAPTDKWLTDRVSALYQMGLPKRKINWYINKYLSYIDRGSIRQEYPCSPEEAFISGGDSIFDSQSITELLARGLPPAMAGYFTYERESVPVLSREGKALYYNTVLKDIRFVEDEGGYIKITEEPYIKEDGGKRERKPYVIGADTSGTGEDYFAAKVIDNTNGRCVATLHKQRMDEEEFSCQLYCLGMLYNEALIAVETNFSRHPVRVLRSLGYPSIFASSGEEYAGFLTTSVSKPLMIGNLVSVMREDITRETDRDTLREMLSFTRCENGKLQGAGGVHDDLVIASAIAHYVGLGYDNSIRKEDIFGGSLERLFRLTENNTNTDYMEW